MLITITLCIYQPNNSVGGASGALNRHSSWRSQRNISRQEALKQTREQTHMHTYSSHTHTYKHTYTHICTHTNTHTSTYILLYAKMVGKGWSFRGRTGWASKQTEQKRIWYTYNHIYSSHTYTYKYTHICTHTNTYMLVYAKMVGK